METKRVVTLIVFILFVMGGLLLYFLIYSKQPPIHGQVINGKDEHGCLVDYPWNETASACIKESKGSIFYQVINFQTCSDAGYAIDENNNTGALQCYALNGTIFVQNSTANKTNASGINYPPNILLYGNFTIAQPGNNTSELPNPYKNITINSPNISNLT